MKKLNKLLSAAAAGVIAAATMTVTAFAEDCTIDVSGAVQTSGDWEQSFTYNTPVITEKDSFDPSWMTADSDVIVEYTYEGTPTRGYPAELIWQTWTNGPLAPDPDVKKTWNRIAPYEYTETMSKYSYEDIVAAYGTDNFSTVYAICVGDTAVKLKVTGITITNCDVPKPENITSISEDGTCTFDVSGAKETLGAWGQSFTYVSPVITGAEGFVPSMMTPDSEVIVEYTYTGEPTAEYPVELIWQTWDDGPFEPAPEINGTWNKIAPYEYSDTQAKYSFNDIVEAYGTNDFSCVYAICVGDTGVKMKVTSLTITNCGEEGSSSAPAESEEEPEGTAASEETTVTTTAETEAETAATTNIAEGAPKDSNGAVIVIAVIIVLLIIAAVVVYVMLSVKKSKGRYY